MLLFFFGYVPVCSEVCQKVIKGCWCVVSEKCPKERLVIFVRLYKNTKRGE